MPRPVVLMATKSQSALADRVERHLEVSCHPFSVCKMRWEEFESGNPDFIIQNSEQIRGADVIYIADGARLQFKQLCVLREIQQKGAYSITVYLPYFPGTVDREDVPGRVVWSADVAWLFSQIPPCRGSGPARVVMFDIHAEQEKKFFANTVIADTPSIIPYLTECAMSICAQEFEEINAIAFPDSGAKKRFEKHFRRAPLIVCDKTRNGEDRSFKIMSGDPRDKHILLVDDLILTGGTTVLCAEALMQAGAKKVHVVVPHLVVPDLAVPRMYASEAIASIHVTDSVPAVERFAHQRDLRIHSVAGTIRDDFRATRLR